MSFIHMKYSKKYDPERNKDGYDMKANDVSVGFAYRQWPTNGPFNFEPIEGSGARVHEDVPTMIELKAMLSNEVSEQFIQDRKFGIVGSNADTADNNLDPVQRARLAVKQAKITAIKANAAAKRAEAAVLEAEIALLQATDFPE